jgi:glycosyltransferase involved in cell wall biosynthesis
LKHKPLVAIIGVRGYPSYYGGFETAVRKLVPFLASKNWRVRVYSREIKSSIKMSMEEIEVIRARGINSKRLSTVTFGFSSIAHSFFYKPDVVLILNVANCIWLPILKIRKIPVIVNVDGIEWERKKWGPFAKRVFLFGAKMTATYADRLIFDSKEIAKYWMNEYMRSGTYIPYGGEIRVDFNPQAIQKDPFLLVVSRLVPENSVESLLIACEQIQRILPIQIVGNAASSSEYVSSIKRLCTKYPDVVWKGHLSNESELFTLWEKSLIYFHGHTVGGTNPALVQAMASACAIVAVDTPFNREVLGEAGIYCDATPEDILNKVQTILQDGQLRLRISKAAQERARSLFSWEAVNSSYQELLMETYTNSRVI